MTMPVAKLFSRPRILLVASICFLVCAAPRAAETGALFNVPAGVQTRWASMENPDGQKGRGATANFGRKGAACKPMEAGESLIMAHGAGAAIVRRMWVTIPDRSPELMRGMVIKMYWDGESKPAVEAPLGDFFCQPLAKPVVFENAWFDNPEGRSFNCRIPMPFRHGFKIIVTNESPKKCEMFFYDVEYTLGDKLDSSTCYFHAHYRRENPTTLRRDFEILPRTAGRGRFLGCNMGINADTEKYGYSWWGEGEVKMYIDGDTGNPTLSGTGSEDYIATGWGEGQYSHLWHGCTVADAAQQHYAFYRLQGPDPVYFARDIRVTIQQIGCPDRNELIKHMKKTGLASLVRAGDGSHMMTLEGLEKGEPLSAFEREDDWCATAYFYLGTPTDKLPPIEPYAARVKGLVPDKPAPAAGK